MVNFKLLTNKSKSTSTITLRTKKTPRQDNECSPSTSQTKEISLLETIKNVIKEVNNEKECISDITRKVVKEELQNHEKNITELIQSKLQATNEHLDKIFVDMGDLAKSLEFIQDQLDDKIGNVKKINRENR